MKAPHQYYIGEMRAGCELADAFLERLRSEPVECDALAQQVGIARMGSLERQRAFCGRIQQELVRGARDA